MMMEIEEAAAEAAAEADLCATNAVFGRAREDSQSTTTSSSSSSAAAAAAAAGRLAESYGVVREWVFGGALEAFRLELADMLYPLFAHAYIDLVRLHARIPSTSSFLSSSSSSSFSSSSQQQSGGGSGVAVDPREFLGRFGADYEGAHADELRALAGAATPALLEECELARALAERRYCVRATAAAYGLLVFFLVDHSHFALLDILNQRVEVRHHAPAVAKPHHVSAVVRAGEQLGVQLQREADQLAKSPVAWGVPEDLRPRLPPPPPSSSTTSQALQQLPAGTVSSGALLSAASAASASSQQQLPPAAKVAKKAEAHGASFGAAAAAWSEGAPMPDPAGLPRMPVSDALERELREDAAMRATAAGGAASVCLFTLFHTDGAMSTAAVSQTGHAVAAGFEDSVVRLWTPKSSSSSSTAATATTTTYGLGASTVATTLVGHSAAVYGLSFRQDEQWLLSAGGDGTARLWWLEHQTAIVCYKGHAPGEPVWDVQFSPVPQYFATGSHDTTARMWTTSQPGAVRVFVGHRADVTCVGFHPNGTLLATGSADRTARLWDVCTGGCVRLFAGHSKALTAVAASPTGKLLATASEDGTVALWDIPTGRRLCTLVGHTRAVYSLAFSAEGAVLASGSGDGTLRLWDTSERIVSLLLAESKPGDAASAANDPAAAAATTVRPNGGGLLLRAFLTKSTPLHAVSFSRRNLLFACGPFTPPSQSSKPAGQLL